MDRAAGCPRESHTAAVKRAQSHSVSSLLEAIVVLGDGNEGGLAYSERGLRESMESVSARV